MRVSPSCVMFAIPPILATATPALIFPNINSWNAGAKGAPSPPSATSLRLKSATTGIPQRTAMMLGSPSCIVKGSSPCGACQSVCPCEPIAATASLSTGLSASNISTASAKRCPSLWSISPTFATLVSLAIIALISLPTDSGIGWVISDTSLHPSASISHNTTSTPSSEVPDMIPI